MKTKPNLLSSRRHYARFSSLPFLLGAMVLVLTAISLRAATVTLYTNDFEAYTGAATALTDEADADVTGSEWIVADDAPLGAAAESGVQVINWLAHSGTQSLLFRSSSEAQIHFPPRGGSRYQLDFWLYVHKGTGNRNFYLIPRGEGSDYNGADYIAYRSDRGTSAGIFYYDGVDGTGAWVSTGATHTEDTWQHHRLVINPNTLKMDLYLDDMENPVATNLDLARCEVAIPTLIRILHEGDSADDGYFALDDFSLTVDDSFDLATTFTDGFENYPARTSAEDDADPQGPWVTTETDGTGTGRALAPTKVQVVNSSVVQPHSGTNCLKIEGGQRAGATIAWGNPPQSDVQVTWWARVPASVVAVGTEFNYLRMSLYGGENGNNLGGDNALLGYGIRNATIGDATSITYYTTGWLDTGVDYTPDTWEQYRLTTHTRQGLYTIIKNPSSANPVVVVDRAPFIGTATNWVPVFMAAWSSSNGTNHPPVYIDDVEVKSLVADAEPLGVPYTPTILGNRFTNYTIITASGNIGKAAVDPRDNTTILVALDVASGGGGIYRVNKVASGNWVVDPVPVVGGLSNPSGLVISEDGTLWWSHDYTQAIKRLKAPWESNVVEEVVSYFGDPAIDDDPIDITIAPANFTGVFGQPGMIVIADRGNDGDSFNALLLLDPATTVLNQTNSNFLVTPDSTTYGNVNLNAIASLPQSGEVVMLSDDGFITAVNGDGGWRYIYPTTLWPLGATVSGATAIATDPTTGRIWLADDLVDEIWSVDPSASGQTPDSKELTFPLTDQNRPERQIDFHDPGLAFAPDGSFLVVTDTSTLNGGGRLVIFHNEANQLPDFSISKIALVPNGVELNWQPSGSASYDILRGTDIANPASFQSIITNLTVTTFTDTNAPAGSAFYRVIAKP